MFSQRTNWRRTPNPLTSALDQAHAAGQPILDLTISNPTAAGIRPDPAAVLAALANPAAMHYDPQPRGLLPAREAVCRYYRESHQAHLNPESLILTTSTSEAYSYIFRLLCNPEDEILVPKPSYPLFDFLADLADVKLIPYPLLYDLGWQIDFDSLTKAATPRTRAILLVHPNNPTGSYVSTTEAAALNALCRERSLAQIVDEVFLDYAHDDQSAKLATRQTFATNSDSLTFTLSGLSKISALPQMKLAWLATSGSSEAVAEAQARLEIIADTFLSMNAPVQLAAATMLDQRHQIQPILRERIRQNLAELDHQLATHPACTRLQIQGGWYAILRVPARGSDEEQAIRLVREAAVSVHPGHFYDFPTEGHLVLSLITAPADFREGIARLLQAVES